MHPQAFFRFLFAILCGWIMTAAAAQRPVNIMPSLVAESEAPAPGKSVTLAILMQPKEGWHGYWKTPGDAGFPNSYEWSLLDGLTPAPLRYPVPKRFLTNGLMNHVFYGDHALLTSITIPAGMTPGTKLPIRIKGRWLACTDRICVPEEGEFGTELTIGDGGVTPDVQKRFDGWRMKLARPLGSPAQFDVSGAKVRIALPLPAGRSLADAWFYAETEQLVNYNAPQTITQVGSDVVIEADKASFGFQAPQTVKGVIAFADGMGLEIEAKAGAVPSTGSGGGAMAILLALAGALLGGVILNIMPCVFPIISLKALSLAKAGGDERTAQRDALAYSAGVILTCLALGGALLALRAGGMAVGWAFQLQDPRVIFFLLLLSAALTFNLAGLFYLKGFGGGEALASQGGAAGSFWTGALAAFVATPCTGPFMAAALGAALILPVPAALGIFGGLGLGLALPFLALAYIPALRAKMPKPGPWMLTFQRWMAVPMALTTAALIWLLWRQLGQPGLMIAGLALVLTAVALWQVGKRMPLGVGLASVLAGLAVAAAVTAPLLPKAESRRDVAIEGAVPFSTEALAKAQADGRPIFLYFTADWCVSCKVNEKVAIDRDEVLDHFKAKKALIMVGDWTGGDPAISRFLESQGRSGVPLYLWYGAGKAEPQVLAQVLTPGILIGLE
jgi:thiol:disulfide interchange protein